MVWNILGYRYHSTKAEAMKDIKKKGDAVAYEGGLGWYMYNEIEYANNPRKRIFGF